MAKVTVTTKNGATAEFTTDFMAVHTEDNELGVAKSSNTGRENKFLASVREAISGTVEVDGEGNPTGARSFGVIEGPTPDGKGYVIVAGSDISTVSYTD